MNVIPPLPITDLRLTSSTVAEPGPGEVIYNSGTAYALGARVYLGEPSSTVTMTIASPCVVTYTANGFAVGQSIRFTTTGALPTGVVAGTTYFIKTILSADTFTIAESLTSAAVNTSGSQSGVHTGYAQIHRLYESLQAGNTGHYPTLAASSTWWFDVGPTNRWAMFDTLRNSASSGDSPMTIVLTPGVRVDSIALLGVVADSVEISVVSGVTTVYSSTDAMLDRDTLSWYDYFFGTFDYKTALIKFDLPPYTNAVITVTLTRASGPVALGALVIGSYQYIGKVGRGAEVDSLNFSTVTRDTFGNATLVPRKSVPKTRQTILTPKEQINRVRKLKDALDAVPAVWSGLDDLNTNDYFESFIILGYYRQFTNGIEHPNHFLIQLELEEL